jgi:hypothetical protein
MAKKTVEVLKQARALVARPDGWHQGDWDDGTGRVCAAGAVVKADTGDARAWYAESDHAAEARGVLRALTPKGKVGAYNDHPLTTQADVVALFDWAIGIEMAGGL